MTPGTYLRNMRENAGVEISDVVETWQVLHLRMCGVMLGAADLIRTFETDLAEPTPTELAALRLAFPFNPSTYRRLANEHALVLLAARSHKRNAA